MKRTINFDNGWEFALLENGSSLSDAEKASFKAVEIPHDWLIYDCEDLYKSGDGWYKKSFRIEKGDNFFSIDFDGVYMDSTVYVNGSEVGIQRSGYASFSYDITDFLRDGENTVFVQVRYTAPNSRWYSGAGIFRSVYLTKTNKTHIANNGLYITADPESGSVHIDAETVGEFDKIKYTVKYKGSAVAGSESADFSVPDFKLWDIDDPNVYTLFAALEKNGEIIDEYETDFGFRSFKLDPDEGFFLNGRYMKIKGVCLHHDMGALGAAVNSCAIERQLRLMKEMGVNAVRTSHNMPSRELLDICDRIGMLVDDESFDMWELSKTEFDNARFFKETAHADVESWIKRDRNRPCVFMWSIGNEIYDTHVSEHGLDIAKMLAGYVREFDPNKHAEVTIASNYIEWENAQKVGEYLVNSGYNYSERCYDEHHKKYPSNVIYGSETSSEVRSRGIYHFPAERPILMHEDNQCSSLGNSCVVWGKPAEKAWIDDRDRKFCAGQFVWTGIDYIGEPTPYSSKNSFFGMADTACFPKDAYYFYQSVWQDKPMIHILPYWDFNEGQMIDVIAYSTADSAELFLNGKSLGRQQIDHKHGNKLHFNWCVPYEKGELKAVAYDENGKILAEDIKHSFGDAAKIIANTDKTELLTGGRDLAFIEISAVDKDGNPVENARNYINVKVSGCGRLMGLDNGDSTDYEQYKTDTRRMFSGRLLAIISSDNSEGEICIEMTSEGLEPARITIRSSGRSDVCCEKLIPQIKPASISAVPVRKIESSSGESIKLDPEHKSARLKFKILPKNATYSDIKCSLSSESGAPVKFAEISLEENNEAVVSASSDGKCTIRISAYNGSVYPQVISEIPLEAAGLGENMTDPYSTVLAYTYKYASAPVTAVDGGTVGGFRENRTVLGYPCADLGEKGSDKLTLYVGNSTNRDVNIEIYSGGPDNGGKLIDTVAFPHNNGWDKPSPLTFKLREKLVGEVNLYFVITANILFGGFSFSNASDPYTEISADGFDNIYGDGFSVRDGAVMNIGNNVVIDFGEFDFKDGSDTVEIVGSTPNDVNAVQIRCTSDGVQTTQLVNFKKSDGFSAQEFKIDKISGIKSVSFVFMPGTKFDFKSFCFKD